MYKFICFSFCLSLLLGKGFGQPTALTEKYYQYIKQSNDVAKMNFFFAQMPKGGDLHHHFGGSLYTETFLAWLAEKEYYINTQSLHSQVSSCSTCISVDSLLRDEGLYERVLEQWSTQDYKHRFPTQLPPDQHFFNTFYYFGKGQTWDYAEGFQNLKNRAIQENLLYLETQALMVPFSIDLSSYDPQLLAIQNQQDTSALYTLLTEMEEKIVDQGVEKATQKYLEQMTAFHEGIDDASFTMRFQAYIVRKTPPAYTFSRLYAAFLAVQKSPLVVGVNIVAPEHGRVSMRDYWLHMHMFRYLSHRYPRVKKSLHAGELALGMVKPEDLTFHITDAIRIAGADRIGHGIDMPYEKDAINTLTHMAKSGKAVEINLTSNEFILGVSGQEHPISLYREFGVPMVISTDDSGVSRNSLSHEYSLLGQRYSVSYKEIKQIVYNGISFSFLSEEDKEENIRRLDMRFREFEENIAKVYRDHVKK